VSSEHPDWPNGVPVIIQGLYAFEAGKRRSDCPFDALSEEWSEWLHGYEVGADPHCFDLPEEKCA
jgi:ribosome modulation factor